MTSSNQEQILEDLAGLVRNFQGREYSGDIGPHTLFFGDLGMVSIDAVVLREMLEQRYGRKFPFHLFLAELSQRGAQDLELGELARFLHQELVVREGEAPAEPHPQARREPRPPRDGRQEPAKE